MLKQKRAYEMHRNLVGSERCIRSKKKNSAVEYDVIATEDMQDKV